ncbi:MAG: 2-polyprenyl-3-methyl-6-methoxy-1,4-benzoquinone monooxygenase [Gammaproteobacteria bacterium]|jgi:ubiquinone biosynthesis monooxygenase Coq7
MDGRDYSPFDQLLMHMDKAVRTVFGTPPHTERPNPAQAQPEAELAANERRQVAGLMRVNHAGEVSAQALYQGQALTAKLTEVRAKMERAALEENDHLAWCEQRLKELDSHTSVLNPLWYAGSFTIGALAGAAGDKWSLGFVVETERQVVKHLEEHLERLPAQDHKSRAILEQMKEDEAHHATTALEAGSAELPGAVKRLMRLTSKIMTVTAYYL